MLDTLTIMHTRGIHTGLMHHGMQRDSKLSLLLQLWCGTRAPINSHTPPWSVPLCVLAVQVLVQHGSEVRAGDDLVVIEAMKVRGREGCAGGCCQVGLV